MLNSSKKKCFNFNLILKQIPVLYEVINDSKEEPDEEFDESSKLI